MLHRRAREEKVHVRKAALQALHKFILFEATTIEKEVQWYLQKFPFPVCFLGVVVLVHFFSDFASFSSCSFALL